MSKEEREVNTAWLRARLAHRATRLPVITYEAVLTCLDELDLWRKAHDVAPPDGESFSPAGRDGE